MGRRLSGHELVRWAAPAAFLVAVTIVVLLVRAGLAHHSSPSAPSSSAPITTTAPATVPYVQPGQRRYYRVQAGDTLSAIALRFQTTVPYLELLNPGLDPANLTVGHRVRIH